MTCPSHFKRWQRVFLLMFVLSVGVLLAQSAQAQTTPINLDICAGSGFTANQYTAKVVACVRSKLIFVTMNILTIMTNYMSPILSLMFVFTTILFGIQVAAGQREITGKSMGFILKVAMVWMFANNLGGYGKFFFDTMDELVAIVSGGFAPWSVIDQFLGKLFGFLPGLALSQGFIGLAGAALFSGTQALTMGMIVITVLFNVLKFVFDIVYTYLSAVLMICFMVIISPFTIPMALFKHTERYFKKWLDITIGAVLTPVLLFAFLSLTLATVLTLVTDIYGVLGDPNHPDFSGMWRLNEQIISWQLPVDPASLSNISGATGVGNLTATEGSHVNPLGTGALEMFSPTFPGINFGDMQWEQIRSLIFFFLALFLYLATIKGITQKIPDVARDIAGSMVNINAPSGSFKARLQEGYSDAKLGVFGLGGAAIGRELGGAVSKRPAVRQLATIMGGVTGALIGRRL